MVPELSRRRLLAGGGVVLGGVGGVGVVKSDWLQSVLPWAGSSSTVPEYVWHPPVSEAHADAAVTRLEDAIDEAERLADRVERRTGSPPRWADDPSGNWLGTARNESDPRKRLNDATSGLASVGHRIDEARTTLGEFGTDSLRSRANAIVSGAAQLRDDLGDYPVSDPSRDLGYLFFLERELGGAEFYAPVDADSGSAISSPHAHLLRSEQYHANARYYYSRYQGLLAADTRPVRADVQDAYAAVEQEIEHLPSRETVGPTNVADADDSDLYKRAVQTLYSACYTVDHWAGYGSDGHKAGHDVQQLVAGAYELLRRRAYQFARSELDVSPTDDSFDRSRAIDAHGRARRLYRSTRSEHDSPLAGLLIEPGADAILIGDERTNFGHTDENYLKATIFYLIAIGVLREVDDVRSLVSF
jgi:hypothetical protein